MAPVAHSRRRADQRDLEGRVIVVNNQIESVSCKCRFDRARGDDQAVDVDAKVREFAENGIDCPDSEYVAFRI